VPCSPRNESHPTRTRRRVSSPASSAAHAVDSHAAAAGCVSSVVHPPSAPTTSAATAATAAEAPNLLRVSRTSREVRVPGSARRRHAVAVQVEFERAKIQGLGHQALSSYGSQLYSTCTAPATHSTVPPVRSRDTPTRVVPNTHPMCSGASCALSRLYVAAAPTLLPPPPPPPPPSPPPPP
jgi:hypothetical protein